MIERTIRLTVNLEEATFAALTDWAAKEMRTEGNAAAIAIAAFLVAQEYTVEVHPRYMVRKQGE